MYRTTYGSNALSLRRPGRPRWSAHAQLSLVYCTMVYPE